MAGKRWKSRKAMKDKAEEAPKGKDADAPAKKKPPPIYRQPEEK